MKKVKLTGLLLFLVVCLCACGAVKTGQTPTETTSSERSIRIYYVNKSATKVVSDVYVPQNTEQQALLEELIAVLQTEPENMDYKKPIPSDVKVLNAHIDNKQAYISFDNVYTTIPVLTETLGRAAVVRTITQIEGVDTVAFYVNEHPLMDSLGQPVGRMRASDFIDDLGGDINDYEKTTLSLYFTNETGDRLIECRRELMYNNTVPMERLVVEQLIKGPSTEGLYPVLPSETKLLTISTREGVCYVNLDASFLTGSVSTNELVPIYAIVNSLAELPNVNKVQIAINGETTKKYRELVSFDKLFERNLDIILEEGEQQIEEIETETEAAQ